MEVRILEFLESIKHDKVISDQEYLSFVGEKLKKFLSADEFKSKNFYIKPEDRTQTDDFLINTEKPYVDNNLSGYSAFPELINYKNKNFKSCLMLPIRTKNTQFGIIILLSLKENAFDQKNIKLYEFFSNMIGEEYEKILFNEKNYLLNRYFDVVFNSEVPQVIINIDKKILRYNKKFLDIIEKNVQYPEGFQIDTLFDFSKDKKFFESKKISTKLSTSQRTFDVSFSKINNSEYHLIFNETTDIEYGKNIERLIEFNKVQLYLLMDKKFKIYWTGGGIDGYENLDKEYFIGKELYGLFDEEDLKKKFLEEFEFKVFELPMKLQNTSVINTKLFLNKNKDFVVGFILRNNEKYSNILKRTIDDIIKFSGEMIVITDTSGYIKSVNDSFEKITGYNRDILNNFDVFSICADKESQRKIINSFDIVKKGGVLNGMEVSIINKNDGSALPSLQTVKPTYDTEGKINGFMFIGKELVTKNKLLETEIALNEMNKKAERLKYEGQLKTQFIYNISHDLKTPITNIMGFSKLMIAEEFGALNEEQKRNLSIIINEGDRLLQLISQILDVAKLESKKIKLDIKPVDFNDIKESPIIKSLENVATNKGIKLSFTVDSDTHIVEADPNRLIQVFVNLISNAIKFTDKGGITVSVKNHGKKNPLVRVEVNDTGIGINKEYKNKLFKKFFQVKKETSNLTRPEGTGTGLGLSIAKEIVSLHGGKIGVTSDTGKGSTFWFVIPISQKQKKKVEQDQDQSSSRNT
ncbi:MAG: PAS domain-containing sensor histidine kinase [Candidatus Micrarchaeaceae archaeon]